MTMKPHEKHRRAAHEKVRFMVITVSSSRYELDSTGKEFTDESGDTAERLIEKRGYKVKERALISDDRKQIEDLLKTGLSAKDVDVVLFTGGTGISPTDVTIETVRPFFDKEMEGFGELLRAVSYERIGFSATLSRATAGISAQKLIVCLPGSPDGVKTGLKLLLDDVAHIVHVAAGRH